MSSESYANPPPTLICTYISICVPEPLPRAHMVGSLSHLPYGALHSGLLNRLCWLTERESERGGAGVTATVTATEWWQTLNMTHKWFKTNFNATAGSPASPRPCVCALVLYQSQFRDILPYTIHRMGLHTHTLTHTLTHVAKLGCWRIKVARWQNKKRKN